MILTASLWLSLQMLFSSVTAFPDTAGPAEKGRLIYQNRFAGQQDVKNWVMEGPGELKFKDGWMEMYSPGKKWDHVFWCPEHFPGSFTAEWEMQNLDTSAGLVIIFFSANGDKGQDIFDPGLPKRDGTFKYYNRGQINEYHISYYSNNPKDPDRSSTNLRKDPQFALLQTGPAGIPAASIAVHRIRLIKAGPRIILYADGRKVIDYTDDGKTYGPAYAGGRIGFRQMRWTHFRYRNFRVWINTEAIQGESVKSKK